MVNQIGIPGYAAGQHGHPQRHSLKDGPAGSLTGLRP